MDIITQAALGAALATAVAPAYQRRVAAGIGLFAGTLADFDALIQSGSDPLLVLDFHRHFTHALAFVPLGALLASLILWPFLRRRLGFVPLYGYSLAGYALSGLLDACTSYGTHLWLPLSQQRVAWNLIAVIDPLFTLLLLIPLLLTLRRPASPAVRIGLLLAAIYLGMGYLQQQRVSEQMQTIAMARGH
ncbi:MAG TPA: metal-dependent hydrolase, partial [Rhodocyclaceae bacterium]|nr:metal-dependent hydrolase [Rhodocyclaceae bacterium]